MGYIYILKNPSFKDYVKIGYADDVEKRLKQLNRSECVPFAFRIYATYEVESRLTDMKVHSMIDRINPDLRAVENFDGRKRVREFYAMSAEDAYLIFEAIAQINGTEDKLKLYELSEKDREEEAEANEIAKKAAPLRFSMCGINPGDYIEYIEDSSLKIMVVDDRHIEFEGEVTSLSALAQRLKGFSHSVQGTLWFTFNGKPLNVLREENGY